LIARGRALRELEGLDMDEAAERVVAEYREAGRLIPGLGHPNHKDYDPRAVAVEKVARAEGVWGDGCEFYARVHAAFTRSSGKSLPINIDGMLAAVLDDMGFTPHEMAGIAATAAMPGIIAHVVEEIEKGVPLRIVPDELGSVYVGEPERPLPPRE
jgi:citrate synthase